VEEQQLQEDRDWQNGSKTVLPRVPAMRQPAQEPAQDWVDWPDLVPPTRPRRLAWQVRYTIAAVTADLCAGAAAAASALALRFDSALPAADLGAALSLPLVWVLLVALNRGYQHHFIGVGAEEIYRVLAAGLGLLAAIALASYGTKSELSRAFVLMAVTMVVALSVLARVVQRVALHGFRARGRCVQLTLIVGPAAAAAETLDRLRRDVTHGMVGVAACITDPGSAHERSLRNQGIPVLDDLDRIDAVVRRTGADVVAVLPSAMITGDELRRLAWRLEDTGAELFVCTGLTEIAGERVSIRPAGFTPLVAVAPARLSGPARAVKGIFDRCAALLGLLLISPVLVAVATVIWCGDRGNPFFCQNRVGRDGREFRIVKFRTMVRDAEARKAELLERNESDGVLFKIVDDPRITPIGRWLRRYSIDELPQLINVVRGEMSLVGPRPPLPSEVDQYSADMRRRLLVKPGMTGLWQVSGRSSLSWAETQLLDIRYVENWSLGRDVAILWRTARAVVQGSGAH
jgi:exopolysaccharide biosynthesis polyprenyl glycosylphosphotransferase